MGRRKDKKENAVTERKDKDGGMELYKTQSGLKGGIFVFVRVGTRWQHQGNVDVKNQLLF